MRFGPDDWCDTGTAEAAAELDIRTALRVDRDVLLYSPEHVKSLTMAELKEALANAVGV